MKYLRLLALSVLASGCVYHCAPRQPLIYDTTHDYDIRVDFAALRHYAWQPFPVTATITSLNAERVRYFVDVDLSLKGYSEQPRRPDFLVEPLVDATSRIDTTGGPAEYGLYREARLALTFVRPASRQIIWHGETRVRVNPGLRPEEKDRLIGEAVDHVLKNFPPPP